MRIGLDVDGVLADFNKAYIGLLNEVAHTDKPTDYQSQIWNYEGELGFTPEQVDEAWRRIKESDRFWYELEPMLENTKSTQELVYQVYPLYDTPASDHMLYFVTARPGKFVKDQTSNWLQYELDLSSPTVLISSQKGLCAQALELDVYVDDKLENILSVQISSPSTRAYLINRPYNANGNVLRRADSVLDVLRGEKLV